MVLGQEKSQVILFINQIAPVLCRYIFKVHLEVKRTKSAF